LPFGELLLKLVELVRHLRKPLKGATEEHEGEVRRSMREK
jgi:hypothetical protein